MRELTEMEDLVVSALAMIPEDYREVLILNLYCGYRLDEIAAVRRGGNRPLDHRITGWCAA